MKSRFNSVSYYSIVLASFTTIVSGIFLNKIFQNFSAIENDIMFTSIFTILILLMIFLSSKIRRIYVVKKESKLKYYGIFFPFGKTLYFKDYKGIYKTTETGSLGSYEVIYLVDHNDVTRFKIMGLYYKNMDEIINSIPLPEIKRNLSGKEYLKLMFTGRADLSKIKDKKNADSKIAFYFKLFSIITLAIFVIGMLIRFFLR